MNDLAPLAAQDEQLAEGRPLQEIPQGVEQCCIGPKQILELGLKPAADHARLKCCYSALPDQLAQALS
jgi:hypothetical protein